MPAVAAVALGVLLGGFSGGSLSGLSRLRLRFEWAILLLFVVQALARGRLPFGLRASAHGTGVWVVCSIALLALLLLNRRTTGLTVVALGTLLNLDVVLLNGAMPVLGLGGAVSPPSGGFYQFADSASIGLWIGDVIPLSFGHTMMLLSVGDITLMVGVTTLVAESMLRGVALQGEAELSRAVRP